ncbi:hypothetical protein N136_01858 [Leifsonia aquatica ATCC 14665]|uniref:Uncharacterized protein n=1 Tax=Leifsonia aquatica ATCC 14665 TaxID=1358026 RepID=U2RTB0_LEIAQ|nr:hypothetical protein N136_01858 [Leifsonia aquatica ATCC 14665]
MGDGGRRGRLRLRRRGRVPAAPLIAPPRAGGTTEPRPSARGARRPGLCGSAQYE